MIETELKYQLTATQFQLLLAHFQLVDTPALVQHNIYYDTPTQQLKQLQTALRLRKLSQRSEWTIKQKQDELRSLELTQFNSQVFDTPQQLTTADIHQADLQNFLSLHQIELTSLRPIAEFTTSRWLMPTPYGKYALDCTRYGTQTDYEVELETQDVTLAHQELSTLFQQFGIPLLPADKKIARVMRYYQSL